MVENLYSHEILAKTQFCGDFEPYFYCACAETARILLPVSNLTMPFDPACPENLHIREILAKNAILWVLFLNVIFALFFALEIFCACM